MSEHRDDGEAPASEPEEAPSLGKEATRGMLWTSLSSLLARAMGFATTIILTYWIKKDDYGRANAALTIADTLGFFAVPGIESELIRRKQRLSQAATLAVIGCTLIWLLIGGFAFALSERIAALFNAEGAGEYLRISLILPTLSIVFLMGNVLLCRQLRFGTQSLLELGGSCSNVGSAISLAAGGLGGLAVVVGQLLREAVIRVGGTIVTGLRWLQRPAIDGKLLKEMLSFGVLVYISELFEFAATNWDNLFVSKVFGAEALGAYAVAYTIAYTPIYTVATRTASVVLAAVARFADDVERRHEAVLRSLGAIMLLLGPASVLIMLDGPRVVQMVFPDRWTAMVSTLVVSLSLVGIGLPLQFIVDYYFQAIGKPWATTLVMGMKLAMMFAALLIFGRSSVEAAAWSVSGSFIVAGVAACCLLTVVDKIPLLIVFRQLVAATVGTTLMAFTIVGLQRWAPSDSNLVMLLLEIGGGGVVYLVYQFVFHRARVMDIVNTLLGRNDDS
jgi:O-antigen/teichoic acid export membrane protein